MEKVIEKPSWWVEDKATFNSYNSEIYEELLCRIDTYRKSEKYF